jgi:hypothetical protein
VTQPLTIAAAAELGLSWEALQSRRWERLACGVYAPRGGNGALERLRAISLRLPAEAAFSGRSAGWFHGLDLDPCDPIEVTVPAGHPVAHRSGVLFHKARLNPWEVARIDLLRVTSRLRTVGDLGGGPDLVESVVALDMALHAGLVTSAELEELAGRATGKGSARLRRAAALAEPAAESPMETRLRLMLILSGLPRPAAQVPLLDGAGELLGRPDLYYAEQRLCIEYDGGTHRLSLVEDDQRQNRLVGAGYTLLRFTVADMSNPRRIVALVRGALATPPRRISPEIRGPRPPTARISPEIRAPRAPTGRISPEIRHGDARRARPA